MVSAAPAFDWNQYPPYEQGGITGNGVDPSQIQMPAGGITAPSSTANPQNPGAVNPGSVSGGNQSAQAYFQSLFPPGSQLSPQMLLDKEADLKAHGITLIKNASGQPGKIQLADGSAFDVIQGAGSGQNIAQWNQIAGPGGAPTGGTLGSIDSGAFVSPIAGFTPPSYQDALKDPGAQYAIDEATRNMNNGFAAKGELLNGRVLQAENNAIMANANTLYGDIYNRAANTYGINFNTQTRNQDAPFQKYTTLAGLGQTAAGAS